MTLLGTRAGSALYAGLLVLSLAGALGLGIAMADTDSSGAACPTSATAMTRLELLFGRGKPDGTSVTDAEWKAFLDVQVTPLFPDGLTVIDGYGQWRDGEVVKAERSIMLVIWHPPGFGDEAKVEAIRSAYKSAFQQQSVMRIDGADCVSF